MSLNGSQSEPMEVDAQSVVVTTPQGRAPTITFRVFVPAQQLAQARNNPQAAAALLSDPALHAQINAAFDEAERNNTHRPNRPNQ